MIDRLHSYNCALRAFSRRLRMPACRLAATIPFALVAIGALAHPEPVGRAAVPVLRMANPEATAGDTGESRSDPVETVVEALGECSDPLPTKERWRIARIINEESMEHGFDPLFITALVQVESGCKPTARGGGARGLTQMLPSTARGVARRAGVPWHGEQTLSEPSVSIQLGLHYLGELEDQLGDPYRAVAAYNMGPARVTRMSSWRAQRTRYVRRVLRRYEELRDQFA